MNIEITKKGRLIGALMFLIMQEEQPELFKEFCEYRRTHIMPEGFRERLWAFCQSLDHREATAPATDYALAPHK